MCIIVYKPANTPLVDDDVLWNCATNNSDGMGYMTVGDDGKVLINRGFDKVDEMIRTIDTHVTEDMPVIYHFRIATSGQVNTTNCHPFPITGDVSFFKHPLLVAQAGFAHNGVFSTVGVWEKDELKELCDTALFVRDVVFPVHRAGRVATATALSMFAEETHSRFAMMYGSGEVDLYGRGWIQDGDHLYSNTSYMDWNPKNRVWTNTRCDLCGKVLWASQGYAYCKDCDNLIVTNYNDLELCPNCWDNNIVPTASGGVKCDTCEWQSDKIPLIDIDDLTICWVCETPNNPDDVYCENCGIILDEPEWSKGE